MDTLPDKPLADLAAQINGYHRQCVEAAGAALLHAKLAGELLIEAKGRCAHGEWLPWLRANVSCSERTIQNYMRVAREWDRLSSKSATVADLSYREAVKLLAAPAAEEESTITREAREFAEAFDSEHAADLAELARYRGVLDSPDVTPPQLLDVYKGASAIERRAHGRTVDAQTKLGEMLKQAKVMKQTKATP